MRDLRLPPPSRRAQSDANALDPLHRCRTHAYAILVSEFPGRELFQIPLVFSPPAGVLKAPVQPQLTAQPLDSCTTGGQIHIADSGSLEIGYKLRGRDDPGSARAPLPRGSPSGQPSASKKLWGVGRCSRTSHGWPV
jgi:hypothetical protein